MRPIFGEVLRRNAYQVPTAPALRSGDRAFDHRQHFDRVRQLADALSRGGLQRQDRISVLAMNSCEYFEIFGAAQWAGFIVNTLNFRLSEQELAWIIGDAAPRVLIFDAQYLAVVEGLRSSLVSVERFVCIGGSESVPDWVQVYEVLIASGSHLEASPHGGADDNCCLMYTSGTTGRPKGVLHSNASIGRLAEVISSELGFGGDTRLLAIAPVFHVGAAALSWAALYRGGAVVLHRGFDADAVLRSIEHERITAIHLVPTMVQALLDAPTFDRYDLSSLKMLMYAAAPMPIALLKRAIAAFGPILYNGYGQTEINMLTLLRPFQHHLEGSSAQLKRLESVGQPHWQCELRIVDDAGRSCTPGEIGEVCAKSETAMSGYWNNSVATQATLREGWVHTGDLGYLDDENYLFLVDRKKDVIISGGENIYSREVEEALMAHSAVQEAAVIGIADAKWGEAVKAVVVLKDGEHISEAELVADCRRRIAAFKCPKSIEFVPELPRLNTGKISKLQLRQRFGTPT